MINGRRYHSGHLIPPLLDGADLSDDEIEVLLNLDSMKFTFESNE